MSHNWKMLCDKQHCCVTSKPKAISLHIFSTLHLTISWSLVPERILYPLEMYPIQAGYLTAFFYLLNVQVESEQVWFLWHSGRFGENTMPLYTCFGTFYLLHVSCFPLYRLRCNIHIWELISHSCKETDHCGEESSYERPQDLGRRNGGSEIGRLDSSPALPLIVMQTLQTTQSQ